MHGSYVLGGVLFFIVIALAYFFGILITTIIFVVLAIVGELFRREGILFVAASVFGAGVTVSVIFDYVQDGSFLALIFGTVMLACLAVTCQIAADSLTNPQDAH